MRGAGDGPQGHQVRVGLRDLPAHPERDREVIALVVWSGLSYEQAARALGVPVGTVRSRLARARARLGAALTTEDEG